VVNMVWAQILLIDVAIQYLLRDGWYDPEPEGANPWSGRVGQVATCVVNCWDAAPQDKKDDEKEGDSESTVDDLPEKETEPVYVDWDLVAALKADHDLEFSDDEKVQAAKVQQLMELLELRGLFVIAFLLLNPDSSDVYRAEKSEVEMPMV